MNTFSARYWYVLCAKTDLLCKTSCGCGRGPHVSPVDDIRWYVHVCLPSTLLLSLRWTGMVSFPFHLPYQEAWSGQRLKVVKMVRIVCAVCVAGVDAEVLVEWLPQAVLLVEMFEYKFEHASPGITRSGSHISSQST